MTMALRQDALPARAQGSAQGLVFDDVRLSYGDVEAVRGVSLQVEPGEVICLLGPSGCGKTSLLRLAAGIEMPDSGRIAIDGQEVAGPSAFVPPERRGIGLVFQDYALFPHLTVLDNVKFGLARVPRAAADMEARAALARVGLEDHAGAYPHELSGGQQQRVALARALAPRPGILLMDEPFSGLDRRLRDQVREDTLDVLRDVRATAIMVTHDPEEAMRLADRIVLLRAGRIAQAGPPEQLYRAPVDLYVARFFCELNELPAMVQAGRAETVLGAFPAPGVADGPAVCAVRPQGISLQPVGGSLGSTGISGRVIEYRSLGEVDLARVALPGLDRPLTARLKPRSGIAAGQDVTLRVDAAEVLVFALSGS
ncbi:ABC transporter ATP-binding protein [Aquabacter cavernae]|uniref:ABC transporter ATP-binding protein n=1 Tax=Aquabacter cavernae TaxID=2496029 RepID=UPI001FE00BD7|nr:ABC transporter ATP-binding protein [Aquabacter cavernae]